MLLNKNSYMYLNIIPYTFVYLTEYEMMLLGDNELEGVLLMNISGLWGTVSWTDDTTLKTVCKLLGYG